MARTATALALPPSSDVRVVARLHPLRAERIECTAPAGSTVEGILVALIEQHGARAELLRHAWVAIGDRPVRQEHWRLVRPKAGALVVVVPLPGDDFGSIAVTALTIGASLFLPQLAWFAGLNKFAQIGIQIGVNLAGSLIQRAIAPSPAQTLSRGDQAPLTARQSITGVSNQARPYGAVPRIYGKVTRYHPPLGARPWTESVGNDHYLRMLFVLGYGELTISDIRIGDTPIANFENVAWQVRTGASGDSPVTLYPDQVHEEALAIRLRYGVWQQRTTQPDTDEISLDVLFPGGLILITNRGDYGTVTVRFHVQYRAVGSGTWLDSPLDEVLGGASEGSGVFRVQGVERSAARCGVRWDVARGRYEIRVQRTTIDDQGDHEGDFQSQTQEDAYWSALRSITNEDPVEMDGLAMIAVRIRASEQLNGVIDSLNCTVQAKLPVWNGATWTSTATRNPAWALVDVLTGPANARAMATSRLDLDAILDWADECDQAARWCDGVVDYDTTVFDLANDIAATGRASLNVRDGLYTIVRETAPTVPVQHFSPRNSRGFRATKVFNELPHGLLVRFPNEAASGQVDEIRVYRDGYDADNATRMEVLDLPFVRRSSQARRAADYVLAVAELRPELYEIETDIEHLVCSRGDLVRVTHDVPLWGVSAARVRSVTRDGSSNATAIVLDAAVPMAGGTSYGVRVRKSDGTSITAAVDTVAGEQTTLAFTTPIAAASPQPVAGDLVLFGESGEESVELLVYSIEPRSDLSARLVLVDAAPEVLTATAGEIPDYDPQITLPPVLERGAPPQPTVDGVRSDEYASIVHADGSLESQIVVSFRVAPAGLVPADYVQVQFRQSGTDVWSILPAVLPTAHRIEIRPVEDGTTYEVRLRSVATLGQASDWVTIEETVVGKTFPPPPVSVLLLEGARLVWQYDDPPPDLAGFELRTNPGSDTNWGGAQVLTPALLSGPPFDVAGFTGTRTYLLRPVDTSGNYATTSAVLVTDLGDIVTDNIVLTVDHDALGYPGAITGGTVSGTDLRADVDSSDLFWGADGDLFWGADTEDFWPADTYEQLVYVATYEPGTGEAGATLLVDVDAVADNWTLEARVTRSFAFWGDDADLVWGEDADLFWAEDAVGAWTPWAGSLGPLSSDIASVEVRFTGAPGHVRAVISNFDLISDVEDVEEYLDNVIISSAGTRLPIDESYTSISNVTVTVQADGNGAIGAVVADKSPVGPLVYVYNAAGAAVNGLVDARIRGY